MVVAEQCRANTSISKNNPEPPYPVSYVAKVFETPDLLQTEPTADFPGGGKEFCAPIAVSNSFMWLASHGYPNLATDSGKPRQDQVSLAKLLGSESYMNAAEGAGKQGIIEGVRKWVEKRGYSIENLTYKGIDVHYRKELTPKAPLSLVPWMKEGIRGNGAVWISIGWYIHTPSTGKYSKVGGHWVTLVGYGEDENRNKNSNMLILHDPSPRAGSRFANEFILLRVIRNGEIVGYGLPQSAAGYHLLECGIHLKPGSNCAILEGAIVLRLSPSMEKLIHE